jgi:Protein of unknown function (DUF3455)
MIRSRCRIMVGFIAMTLASSVGIGRAATMDDVKAPSVPPDIQVPEGNTAFLVGHAAGTQNYVCLPSGSGFSWTFFSPQATLFQNVRWLPRDVRQQIITHFLSPNPFESGKPRATWQSSFDTSAVWGKVIASVSDPNVVAAGAIPWLLVQVVGVQRGPTAGATLTPTSFIQRLNTSGGAAPSAGCSQSTDVGSTALVPYTADYFFYKASGKN